MEELALDPKPVLHRMVRHPDNYQHAEKIVDDPFVVPRLTQRADVKVGVMGFPQRASARDGRRIARATVEAVSRKVLELEARADGTYREVAFTPEPLLLKQAPAHRPAARHPPAGARGGGAS